MTPCTRMWSDTHISTSNVPSHACHTDLACMSHTHIHTALSLFTPISASSAFTRDIHTHVPAAPGSSRHPPDPGLTPTFLPCPWQTIEFDGSAGAVLRIQPLRTPRDENVYECVAQNSVGEITVHAKLTVLRGIGLPGVDGGGTGPSTLGTNTSGICESLALAFLFVGTLISFLQPVTPRGPRACW